MARSGRAFEIAVCEFYKGLDPNAKVLFDHKVPDRQTGIPRQVDVWITLSLGGHIPMSVLVSCKDHARPLGITAIESLHAEVLSTGANVGVLYGRSGFTKSAIKKARANGLHCCRLFDNAPPEMPSELLLEAFVVQPQHVLQVEPIERDAPPDLRWADVMRKPVLIEEQRFPLADVIAFACRALVEQSEVNRPRGSADDRPLDIIETLDLRSDDSHPRIRLSIAMIWRWHAGELDAFRLTGSMELTKGAFKGTASVSPLPVDTGPFSSVWKACSPPPAAGHRLRIILSQLAGPTPEQVVQVMARDRVFNAGPWVFGPPPAIELNRLLMPGVPGPLGMQISMPITRRPDQG